MEVVQQWSIGKCLHRFILNATEMTLLFFLGTIPFSSPPSQPWPRSIDLLSVLILISNFEPEFISPQAYAFLPASKPYCVRCEAY